MGHLSIENFGKNVLRQKTQAKNLITREYENSVPTFRNKGASLRAREQHDLNSLKFYEIKKKERHRRVGRFCSKVAKYNIIIRAREIGTNARELMHTGNVERTSSSAARANGKRAWGRFEKKKRRKRKGTEEPFAREDEATWRATMSVSRGRIFPERVARGGIQKAFCAVTQRKSPAFA